jgi:hypothetical protein
MFGHMAHILHRHSQHQNVITTTLGICSTRLDISAACNGDMNMPVSHQLMLSKAEVLRYVTRFLSGATSQTYYLSPTDYARVVRMAVPVSCPSTHDTSLPGETSTLLKVHSIIQR